MEFLCQRVDYFDVDFSFFWARIDSSFPFFFLTEEFLFLDGFDG
jgi:hypothetical protein